MACVRCAQRVVSGAASLRDHAARCRRIYLTARDRWHKVRGPPKRWRRACPPTTMQRSDSFMTETPEISVGIIGTGFVARHFSFELERRPSWRLGKVLTRRPLDRCQDFPHQAALTNSLDALIEASDVVFECTGDAFYAARTIGRVLDAGKPVVTLNAEFHFDDRLAFRRARPAQRGRGRSAGLPCRSGRGCGRDRLHAAGLLQHEGVLEPQSERRRDALLGGARRTTRSRW